MKGAKLILPILAILGWLVFTGILFWLAFGTALNKGVSTSNKVLLVTLGMIALIVSILVAERVIAAMAKPASFLSLGPIAALYSASVASFGFWLGLIGIFPPPLASESKAGAIEAKTTANGVEIGKANDKLDRILGSSTSRIRTRIVGRWGRDDCAIVWRFNVVGDALTIDVERPRGAKPAHMIATITPPGKNPDEMRTDQKGRSAIFTYSTNGVTEGLRWDDQQSPALDLERCP